MFFLRWVLCATVLSSISMPIFSMDEIHKKLKCQITGCAISLQLERARTMRKKRNTFLITTTLVSIPMYLLALCSNTNPENVVKTAVAHAGILGCSCIHDIVLPIPEGSDPVLN